jgi:Integrase core domain
MARGRRRQRMLDLNGEQARLLERFSPEFRERHIEVKAAGELLSVDTFFVGSLKRVGKVYLQTALDCFSRYAFGRLYTSKLPVTAVPLLNEDVLPFFEHHGMAVRAVVSDSGREFCGRPDLSPMNCSSGSMASNTGPLRCAGRRATASSNGCTRRCSTSTFASRGARSGTKA